MACALTRITRTIFKFALVLLLAKPCTSTPQLDLPPISSTQRYNNGYGLSSTQSSINSPGNQYDIQNQNFGFSTVRPSNPSTPGVFPVSSTFRGINPDINNNGYPNVNYGTGNPSSTLRPFDETNRDDRIDINNDPNFRRNDPNFARNDPSYAGANPYDFNRGVTNSIDDRFHQVNLQQVRDFLLKADDQASKECTNNVAAQWNFETDVNDATQHAALDAQQRYTLFQRGLWEAAQQVPRGAIRDYSTFRQLRLLSIIGPSALPPDQLDRYNRLINDMLAVYNTAEICAYNEPFKCGLHLQPELQFLMSHSRDWDELQHVWTEWRRNTGRRIRDLYEQLVDLTNQAARLNNFTDASAYWMFPYETVNMRQDVEEVWEQVKPLYELLHAYVRRRLRESYGPERISRSAPIPAHVLGDMWGQSWSGIVPFTLPYPGKTLVDVTPEMAQQGYTPLTVFQLAEEFFVSMNMSGMPPDFWALSVLDQPADRHVHCQPSAWDFCNKHDYRIKMCTHVDMKDLVTAHHEMAHIEYFLSYRNQPKVFRDGANPGFHEAIGEAIALSVASPRHLQTLGLVQKSVDDTAHDTNYLFTQAMDKLAFLPFALVMDRWRWDVFTGDIRKEQYNCHWWRLREQYQGIKPPVLRSELDFDPGSKYHIPANIPYIR
ncbi:angiotensin-converting enzyme [Ostrinia nubilalis]|uniref:angiotensin-converting enzyme n=1 Tax=Ostrinia nubilalis TaxID=29057 RepID=UPI0030825414